MNALELIRRRINNARRQKQFARKAGVTNFKLIPGWMLQRIDRGNCFFSQCGQDWFVATYIFPELQDGVFVDVGANHPTEISNTLYFEKKGWTGIAFEPQKELCALWDTHRKTTCFPYVLGAEKKQVLFQVNDAHTLSAVVQHGDVRGSTENCLSMEQHRLDEVLLENNVQHVDYLSIDVEGYEKDVLTGIDFSKVDVQCAVLENDHSRFGDESLRKQMEENGYRFIARICGDDVFVKAGSEAESNYLSVGQ